MKKIFSLLIILLLAVSFTMSCSTSAGTVENSNAAQGGKENAQSDDKNTGDKPAAPPAAEFKIIENDTFAYVDDNGILKFRNIKDNDEQAVCDKKGVFGYDFNFKYDLAAYVVQIEKDSVEAKLYIQNMKTNASEELDSGDTTPRKVDWSADGRYLAVNHGTAPTGLTRVYDTKDSRWLEIAGPLKSGIVCNNYLWSHYENALALSIPEIVEPSTPVGDGDSMSIAVYYLDKSDFRVILKGNSDFGFDVVRWADAENLYIRKMFFTDFEKKEYYKINIGNGSIAGTSEADALGQQYPDKLPEEVKNVLHDVSPDGKLILYSFYDELSGKRKVMLWDIIRMENKEICLGSNPKWIAVEK